MPLHPAHLLEQPPPPPAQRRPPTRPLAVGTRLVREWNGRTYIVDVIEDGFLLDGRTYGSLSAVANTITGSVWSGPRFFGVKR